MASGPFGLWGYPDDNDAFLAVGPKDSAVGAPLTREQQIAIGAEPLQIPLREDLPPVPPPSLLRSPVPPMQPIQADAAVQPPAPLLTQPPPVTQQMGALDVALPGDIGDLARRNITTTTTSVRPAPGEEDARLKVEGVRNARKSLYGDVAKYEADLAGAEAEYADQRVAAEDLYNKSAEATQAALRANLADADARIDRATEALKNQEPSKFWNDKNTENKILIGIGVFLSGLGTALSASAGVQTENLALKTLNGAIDSWDKRERQKIQAELDRTRERKTGYRESADSAMAAQTLKKSVALSKAKALFEAKAARARIPEAELKKSLLWNQLDEQSALERQKAVEELRSRVTTNMQKTTVSPEYLQMMRGQGGPGGLPIKETGPQADGAASLQNMATTFQQLQTLPALSKKDLEDYKSGELFQRGVSNNPITEWAARKVGVNVDANSGLSAEKQQAMYAYQSAMSYVLKALSGTGVTTDEHRRKAQELIPQPGDKPETAAAKTRNFRSFILAEAHKAHPQRAQQILNEFGVIGPQQGQQRPAQTPSQANPPTPPPGAELRRQKSTGRYVFVFGDGRQKFADEP